MTEIVQATITLLSLVNPLVCAAMFSQACQAMPTEDRRRTATQAVLAIAVILAVSAVGGAYILKVFGISLPAFRVAGGVILSWMGFVMLRGNASPTSPGPTTHDDDAPASANSNRTNASQEDAPPRASSDEDSSSITPLILFAASPGTITGVITIAAAHSENAIPVTVLIAIAITLTVTWGVLVVTSRKSSTSGQSLWRDVSSRFMGLIILAMGVQFALGGIQAFFAN